MLKGLFIKNSTSQMLSREIRRHTAFTLAEVLIVLGVIGVVAELTIPTLVKDTKKQQTLTAFKAGVSILNQGFAGMMAKEGVSDLEMTSLMSCTDFTMTSSCVGDAMASSFKIIKNSVTTEDSVMPSGYRWFTYPNDGNQDNFRTLGYSAVLANGASILISPVSPCVDMQNGNGEKRCGYIYLDVNGNDKPNMYGKDLYILYFSSMGTVGGYRDNRTKNIDTYWAASASACGTLKQLIKRTDSVYGNCAARVIENGWSVDYY